MEGSGKSILCRVRTMKIDDYLEMLGDNITQEQKSMMVDYFQEKQILDLPTYNQYFYISSDTTDEEEVTTMTTQTENMTSVEESSAMQSGVVAGTGY